MHGDARVKQLLDSLVEIERERESYNAVGGVDPVFVALTARANELGHSIEALAETRREELRRELAALAPPPSPAATALAARPLPDTMARIRARDTARAIVTAVATRLGRERAELMRLDSLEDRARELANVGASPPAMLAAALIIGAMIGFGIAFLDEVRRPRIANSWEAERATGARVLGVIRPLPPSPERGRRASDREGPPYIDPGADGHQLIYLAIAAAGANVVMLTVIGDSPAVSAVVAINFAAIAAQEARATLLIDTDPSDSVEAALRLAASPGVIGLVEGKTTWPEVTRATRIGRDRTIDVVPSGHGQLPLDDLVSLLQRDAARLSRRYDALVLVSSPEQVTQGLPAALPIPDVIYCARVGQTPIAELKKTLEEIERVGGRLRGLVLWNAPDPALSDVRPVEESRRELATV
jgi:Mrp family chromosome partitioning ATPase